MLDIRIQPTDDKQFQEILDTLRPMGVELVTGEQDPLVSALFYVARINSKLDNLGQLSHLNKMRQILADVSQSLEPVRDYYKRLNQEEQWKHQRKRKLYDELKEQIGHDPKLSMSDIQFLTEREIVLAFEGVDRYYSSPTVLEKRLSQVRST